MSENNATKLKGNIKWKQTESLSVCLDVAGGKLGL